MKKLMLVLMMGILGATPVWGSTLALEQVSSEANWVVHVDSEWIWQSHLGRLIRQGLAETDAEVKMENFATIFSFHPLDDIHSITLYGKGPEESKAVVLIKATFEKDVILALLRMNDTHKESNYGDRIIHSWVDDKDKDKEPDKVKYGSFYNQELVVIGGSREVVVKALDVMEGKAANAKTSGTFDSLNMGKLGVMIMASAQGIDEMVTHKQAMSLKQTEALKLSIGENEKKFYIDVNLTAKSAEAADNIGKMAQGMLAFGMLAGEEHPQLAKMAQAVELYWQGKDVRVYFEWSSDDIYAVLKQIWRQKQNKQKEALEPQEQNS
jgi:hypothetical protein